LEREPSYFKSLTDSIQHDVFVGIRDGNPIGCGSRVVREAWWDGKAISCAYLGDLRCHPSMQRRAGWLIRDGYRALADCHAKSPAAVTWTAVFEENTAAQRVLTGRSAGIPTYVDRGRLYCPIILVPRWAKPPKLPGTTWQQGQERDWEEVASFLNTHGCRRPLAPLHSAADFAKGERWPCLAASDFILARREGRLIGVVAVWDLRPVKQVRITAIHGWLGKLRGPINTVARLSGWPSLPKDGTVLPMTFASFIAVENEDPNLVEAMLLAARASAAQRGVRFLCACAHEAHPFAAGLRRLRSIPSHGRLYEVEMGEHRLAWSAIAPHIEPALL
jgi:hypothetical protein